MLDILECISVTPVIQIPWWLSLERTVRFMGSSIKAQQACRVAQCPIITTPFSLLGACLETVMTVTATITNVLNCHIRSNE